MRPSILDIGRQHHRTALSECGVIDVDVVLRKLGANAGVEHYSFLFVRALRLGDKREGSKHGRKKAIASKNDGFSTHPEYDQHIICNPLPIEARKMSTSRCKKNTRRNDLLRRESNL